MKGRFYAGTMPIDGPNKKNGPKGTLYCLDQYGNVKKIMDGFNVINGLAFSPDSKTVYVSDSANWVRTIWAYDYDLEEGVWSNKRIFLILRILLEDQMVVVLTLTVVIGWLEFLDGK